MASETNISKILITGGAGFIGSHLCRRLTREGHSVVAVDNLSQGDISLVSDMLDQDNFTFIEADIFDSVKMQSFKHNHFDMVYQLVANTSVQKGGVSPLLDIRETLSSTLEVLNYVAQYGVKKFMYASSSTVYGTTDEVMRETSAHLLVTNLLLWCCQTCRRSCKCIFVYVRHQDVGYSPQ